MLLLCLKDATFVGESKGKVDRRYSNKANSLFKDYVTKESSGILTG